MDTLRALFKSRKFITALATILGILLAQIGMGEVAAAAVTEALILLALAYILGTAYEDGKANRNELIERHKGD